MPRKQKGLHWIYDRIPVPDWVKEQLDWYADLYGKTATDVVREAMVEKAFRIKDRRGE